NDGNLTSVTSGGQTTSLEWDYNDRLKKITYPSAATNTFQTNDLGQRVSKTDSGGTTSYLFDGQEANWAVLSDSRADYTRGGGSGTTIRVWLGSSAAIPSGVTAAPAGEHYRNSPGPLTSPSPRSPPARGPGRRG